MQRYRLHSVTERLRQSNKNKVSEQNFCSNESRSSEYFREYGHFKEVTRKDGRIMVKEIVDSVLNKSAGIKVVPSSCCSFVTGFEGSEHMDKRLKQWHDTLRDRARVQMKICERIGRRPQEMLLNQSGTLDQRRKGNFNRIMDYADRLNPTRLKLRQYGVLPAHSDAKHCVCLPEIKQTVPRPERSRVANLEITGLSNTTQNEIFGKINTQTPKSSWINSEEFAKNLNEKADDIDRVIEFFPDVGNLEVIGYNQIPNLNHQSNIDLMHIQSIYSVSSSTEMSSNKLEEHTPPVEVPLEPKVFNVALKINDKEFNMDPNGSMFTSAHFEFHFECSPFERQCKQTMRLENIGRMIFFCEWSLNDTQRMTDSTQLNAHSFYFEKSKFRIYPGDVHVINVMFQPCAVLLSKEHWKLRIFPQIFCNRRSGLTMLLVGKSVASPEYLHKINKQLDLVIDKVRMTTALGLTKLHAALAPIIKPHEQLCPYDRILDEREQFNIQNVGYHCERFDDIETLRALYNDVKMPREPPWDMRLDTIRRFIMRLPEANKREIYFQVLLTVLERLHCASDQRSSMDSDHNNERERSCFIYVRGCIGNGIDEWQDLMMSIEEGCFRTELQHFCKCDSQDSTFKIDAPKNPSQMKLKNEQPAVYVHRMMQSKKYYRDAVYMQTYTQLCDMAENVVSVIESTRCI